MNNLQKSGVPDLRSSPSKGEDLPAMLRIALQAGQGEGDISKPTAIAAFTLIELLVVTLMLGLVAAAISACLVGGMRAWESVQNFNTLELNILPPLLYIEREMRNSVEFFEIDFKGGDQEMQFASLVSVGGEPGSSVRIGTIRYYYDARREVLLRKAWVYPEEEPDSSEIVMSGLDDIGFEYFYTSESEGVSSGDWGEYMGTGSNYLGAVRIRLTSGRGREETELVRTVVLPVARIHGKNGVER